MASRTTAFWTFIALLVLLHLILRVALGMTAVPDLILVAALLGARRLGAPGAALLGLLLGVLADSLATIAFGATVVALVIVCYLGSRSRKFFEGDSYLFVVIYSFLGAWLIYALRFLFGGYMQRGRPLSELLTEMPLSAGYVALATVVSLIAYRAISGHR